jgi:hypothetical protein
VWNTRARFSRVRLSCQRRQKRSVEAGLAIEDIARGRGRCNVRSATSAVAPSVEHKSPGQDVPCESASTEVKRAVRLWRTRAIRWRACQRSPPWDGRGDEHRGDGRGPGETPRPFLQNSGAARLACRMPASWRDDWHPTGSRVAISVTGQQRDCTQRHIV